MNRSTVMSPEMQKRIENIVTPETSTPRLPLSTSTLNHLRRAQKGNMTSGRRAPNVAALASDVATLLSYSLTLMRTAQGTSTQTIESMEAEIAFFRATADAASVSASASAQPLTPIVSSPVPGTPVRDVSSPAPPPPPQPFPPELAGMPAFSTIIDPSSSSSSSSSHPIPMRTESQSQSQPAPVVSNPNPVHVPSGDSSGSESDIEKSSPSLRSNSRSNSHSHKRKHRSLFEKGFSKGYKNGFREGENYAKRKRDEDRLIRKKDITEALAGQGENLIPFMAYVIQCAKIQSEMLTVQSTAINAHASEQRAALESLARVQQTANALLAAQHASIHQRQSQDEEEQEEVSAESANEEEEEQEQEEASAEMQQSEDPPPAEEPQELTLQNLTLRHFKGVNATGKSKKVTKTAKLLFINVFKALQKSPFEISAKFPEIIRPGTEEIDVPHLDKTMGAFSRERLDAFVAECSKVWK